MFMRAAAKNWFYLLIFIVVLAAPPFAHSYVLQGPHLLELIVEALSGKPALRVEQQVTIQNETADHQPLVLNETLGYQFPDRLRLDENNPSASRIHLVAGNRVIDIVNGQRATASDPLDRYAEILLYHSRQLLHKTLLYSGVDVEKTSFGRFEDSVFYVIGAQFPDESVSQLWVEKDSFLPMRWLIVSPNPPNEILEFRFRLWRKDEDYAYPMQIECYRDQRLIRTIQVREIHSAVQFPVDYFDVSHLMALYPQMSTQTPITQPAPEVDEVQRTIESFQKKFNDQ